MGVYHPEMPVQEAKAFLFWARPSHAGMSNSGGASTARAVATRQVTLDFHDVACAVSRGLEVRGFGGPEELAWPGGWTLLEPLRLHKCRLCDVESTRLDTKSPKPPTSKAFGAHFWFSE